MRTIIWQMTRCRRTGGKWGRVPVYKAVSPAPPPQNAVGGGVGCWFTLRRILYFWCMTAQCQKCGKDYEPKRRGGKFCSTSCRVVQHQLVKRGKAWTNPTTADEQYLAHKLEAVGRSAAEVLAQVEDLPAAEAVVYLRAVVQAWTGLDNNSIIGKVKYHEQRENTARTARMTHLQGATSVSNKRKLSRQA